MTDQITMENNYLYKIELKDKENILIVKNLITNEDINLSLFNANEQEISNIFENVTNNLWNIEEKDLEKSEIINLSLIKEDKENINNQIVLTFANIFNREIKLIKEDILKIKKELLI
ncbi:MULTISPECIES: hypothetical protein [unclassified Spiroplasma]|uniref:hypothetical protein n=1 Tax=unclassified Spiroplasma TaxID=2637901 RepID=UPI0030D0F96C